ncbi:MAG: ATP-binding cassette domain-containing protein [Candidatus Atribacteria bacterium]|nr:ATP-binding cassette domain-containing protein [Candidatus Atribacteria bacterium]
MIEVNNLKKIFFDKKRGEVKAVNGINLHCRKGEIFGLLGPNGAGKTTTLRILATMLKPTVGEVSVNGYDVIKEAHQVRASIGFLSGETGLYDRFTPKETILFFGRINNLPDEEIRMRMDEIFEILDMKSFQEVRVDKLSTGMKQKLSIARALIHNPPILIFDEPTVGLDVITARVVLNYIKEFKNRGKCIIFSTHQMQEAERLCDRIAIIHKGEILAKGSLEELQQRFQEKELEEIFFKLIRVETGVRP